MKYLILTIFILASILKGPRHEVIHHLLSLLILFMGTITFVKLKLNKKIFGTNFDFFIVALFLWVIVSSVFGSLDIYKSLLGLMSFAVYLVIFYLFVNYKEFDALKKRLIFFLGILGFLFSLIILLDNSFRIFNNVNHLAAYLVCSLFACIYTFYKMENKSIYRKIVFSLITCVIVFAIVSLKSRGAVISFWCSVLLNLLIIPVKQKSIRLKLVLTFMVVSSLLVIIQPVKKINSQLKFDDQYS
ncbi:hypothetical protein ACFL4A_04290, partial [bacterium]